MSYFMKIRPVGADLFHVDKQTDMKKLLTVADFLNFADEPKNENFCIVYEDGYSFLL